MRDGERMAITRIFGGVTLRVPGNYGGLTVEQQSIRDLKFLLRKLDIKSAGFPRGYTLKRRMPGPKL